MANPPGVPTGQLEMRVTGRGIAGVVNPPIGVATIVSGVTAATWKLVP